MEKITKDEALNKTKSLFTEFKIFIQRGNVLDLAIGVVLGTAFGKIVSSLVNDIIMPLIGALIGGLDFSDLSFKIGKASINYGLFIQNIIDFIIVAFCIFLIVKVLNKFLSKVKKEEKKPEPVKTPEVLLLEQIRDELKK